MRIDGPQITGSFTIGETTFPNLSALATTGSNLFKGTQTISGSLIPAVNNLYDLGSETHQFRHVYISSGSLYIDGTKVLGSTSSELQITTDVGQSFKILESGSDNITLQSVDGNIELKSSGGGDVVVDPTNGVIGLKGTVTIYTGNKIVSSDGNSVQFGNGIAVTGSIVSTVTPLVSGSSQITYSGLTGIPLGIISGSAQLPNELISGSSQITSLGYATTGSNNFQGTQTITGSLFISQNLVVQGSSSLQNITASAVNIGANLVNLNTATPAIRFSGLNIFDSGSIGGSGSFLYDAIQDEFIFIHRGDNINITSSVVLMGPQTYNNVGSEIYPTNNRILKGTGNEHIGDSIISETGGGIGISGSLSVSGSITTTGTATFGDLITGQLGITSGVDNGAAARGFITNYQNHPNSRSWRLIGEQTSYADFQIQQATTKGGSTYTNILRFDATGASTFSSSITASGNIRSTSLLQAANDGVRLGELQSGFYLLDVNDTNGLGLRTGGSGGADISLTPTGLVGIGTTVPYTRFQVNGGNVSIQSDSTAATDGVGDVKRAGYGFRHASADLISALINTTAVADWGLNLHFNTRQFNAVMPGTPAMTITAGQNIGIGMSNPQSKFVLQSSANYETSTLGSATANTFTLLASNGLYGMTMGVGNSGNTWFQSQRVDAGTASYNLLLNPQGGNILINTTSATGAINVDTNRANLVLGATTSSKISFNNGSTTQTGYIYNDVSETSIGYPSIFNIQRVGVGNVFTLTSTGAATFTSTLNLPNAALISVNSEPDTWGARFRTTISSTNLGSALKNIIWCGGGSNEGFAVQGSGTGASSFEVRNDGRAWIKENLTVGGTLTENSSLRYKENIEPIKYGLEKVIQMRGVTYNKKDNGVKELGVIAEEINEILPEVVLKNDEGEVDSVSYGRLTAVLIEAIKELKVEIEELKLNR
jgi:hypothetical protein